MDIGDILQTVSILAAVVGGLWALFLYRTARRGQVRVAIEHSASLIEDFAPNRCLLVVRLLIRNMSSVLWRFEYGTVTLFDARKLTEDGEVRLAQFAVADPLLPVYGVRSDDPQEEPFSYLAGQEIMLEPGEFVESHLAFPLRTDKLGLMAAKVELGGFQRRRARTPYEWCTFFYIDPQTVATKPPDVAVALRMEEP
jgi:hypothetical protein